MVPIAIVVILIVIVFTIAVVLAPDPATLSIFGAQINANTTGVYFTGAVTMLVLLVALLLLRHGISRSVRRRKEVQTLKKQAEVGSGSTTAPDRSEPTTNQTTKKPVTKKPVTKKQAKERRPETGTRSTEDEGTSTSSERQSLLAETDSLLGDERDR